MIHYNIVKLPHLKPCKGKPSGKKTYAKKKVYNLTFPQKYMSRDKSLR